MIKVSKNLFSKSLFAGICFGIGAVCSGVFRPGLFQGLIISLVFVGIMKLSYPLMTERGGDSDLSTTFAGYPTVDTIVLKLFAKRIVLGNFLGIIIAAICGLLLISPSIKLQFVSLDSSWWRILMSSILTGLLVDLGARAFYKKQSVWLILILVFAITVLGFNHVILDLVIVINEVFYNNLNLLIGIKILLFSTIGNFLGCRLRNLLIGGKDEED